MPKIKIAITPSLRVEPIDASHELGEFVETHERRTVALRINDPKIIHPVLGAVPCDALGIIADGVVVIIAIAPSEEEDAPAGASLRDLDLVEFAEVLTRPAISGALDDFMRQHWREHVMARRRPLDA